MGVSLSRSEFPGKGSRAKLHTEPLFSHSSLFSLEKTGRDLSRSPESPTESQCQGVYASPCYFTIGAQFSSMPRFQKLGLVEGTRQSVSISPRLWGSSPL